MADRSRRRAASPGNPVLTRLLAGELLVVWAALVAAGWVIGTAVTSVHPGFDAAGVTALRGTRASDLTTAMRVITWFGSPVWLDIVFAAACVALYRWRAWSSMLLLVLASPGTVLMVQLIKHAVGRTRPLGMHLTHADGPSWPSGHASSSAALYGALFLIVMRSDALSGPTARRAAAIAVTALVGLIGLSRVYLGVHYPTDVVAAWLLTAGWLNVVHSVCGRASDRRVSERRRKSPWDDAERPPANA